MSVRRIVNNTFILTASSMIVKVLAYAVYFLIAHHFSTEEVGVYALIITVYLLAELLSNLGLDKIVMRELSGGRNTDESLIIYSTILFRLVSAVIVYILCLGLINWIYPEIMTAYGLGVIVFFVAIPILAFARSIECVFMAREKTFFVALSQFCERLYLVVLLSVVWLMDLDFKAFLFLFPGAGIVRMTVMGIAFQWPGFPKNFFKNFCDSGMRSVYLQGFQMLAIETLALIYFRIDIFMLSRTVGLTGTGLYQIAYKIFDCCIAVFAGYLLALFPTISREHDKTRVVRMILVGMVVILPVTVVVISLRSPILRMFGPEYVQASAVLILLMLSFPIVYMTSFFANYAIVTNKLNLLIKLTIVLSFTNILLNWLLIPKYDILGAAISTFVCEAISLIVLLWKFSSFYKNKSIVVGVSF